jgi:DNA-binding transcriptional ArsR family regulator
MSEDSPATIELDQLFGLLGNRTRMQIMQALWDGFEFTEYVIEDRDGTSFSRLREQAGIEDPGNFNYHLGKLVGTLVESRDDGYVLTPLGYNLMGAIDRYSTYQYATRDDWTIDAPCPFCGGTLIGAYRREILEVRCQDCGGLADDGNFTFVTLPSSGAGRLDRNGLLDAAAFSMMSKIRSSMHGICWECHAPVTLDVEACEDHARTGSGTCSTCSNRYQATVDVSCPTCGTRGFGPLVEYAIGSPPVGTFFASIGSAPWDIGPWRYRLGALGSATETVLGTDPVTVTFQFHTERASRDVTLRKEGSRISVLTEI